jgi:hypothetical protein
MCLNHFMLVRGGFLETQNKAPIVQIHRAQVARANSWFIQIELLVTVAITPDLDIQRVEQERNAG